MPYAFPPPIKTPSNAIINGKLKVEVVSSLPVLTIKIIKIMKAVHVVTFTLLVIGGLNWLLVAFGWNLVSIIFGVGVGANVVYFLIGVSAIFEAIKHLSYCKMCSSKGAAPMQQPMQPK